MRPKTKATLTLLCVFAFVAGCGGGSSSEGGSASISLRALWQQPDAGLSAAAGGGAQVVGNGFGPEIPAAVRTVQLTIESGAIRCCLAIPRDEALATPIADPEDGRRTVILDDLPEGAASVVVRGFRARWRRRRTVSTRSAQRGPPAWDKLAIKAASPPPASAAT
jgi:hypothetical protein